MTILPNLRPGDFECILIGIYFSNIQLSLFINGVCINSVLT